jgi:hypothetical protein
MRERRGRRAGRGSKQVEGALRGVSRNRGSKQVEGALSRRGGE